MNFPATDEAVTVETVTKVIERQGDLDSEAELLQGYEASLKLSFRAAGSNLDQVILACYQN